MIGPRAVARAGRPNGAKPAVLEEVGYPYRGSDGRVVYEVVRRPPKKFFQRRPDPGRPGGWISNLEGVERVPYRLPELLEFAADLRDPKKVRAVFVVEGEKDVERLRENGLVATTNAQGANWTWPDEWARYFEGFEQAFVLPDNDEPGRWHAEQVAAVISLVREGFDVRVVELVGIGPGGDVSDFLEAGGTIDQLWRACDDAASWRPPGLPEPPEQAPAGVQYRATGGGIVRLSPNREGHNETQLTNFCAEIVADEQIDDGVEVRRSFQIEARMNGGQPRTFVLPAERFADVQRWSSEHLGARAIVFPGQSIAAHARVAIQVLSQSIEDRLIFAHTGWRLLRDGWVYLHGDGAIGPAGVVPGVQVRLGGKVAEYRLPEPPTGEALVDAVRSSLSLLDLAPMPTMAAVLGAAYRAVLGPAAGSVAVIGSSGHGKSELAARAQQHFGANFDALNLPGTWGSTGNALEELTFIAKDALQVIDDFAPEGSHSDIQRAHATAARVHRAQGNRAGRQRMRADQTMRAERPPRGLVLSTGEETPRGESVRARMLIAELPDGALRWDLLTPAQEAGRRGQYAAAMAGFLRWLAPRYGTELAGELLDAETAKVRDDLATSGRIHRRTPDAVASLLLGWRYFLAFALAVGTISNEEHDATWVSVIAAFADLAAAQRTHQAEADPVFRFLDSLRAALVSGDGHLTDPRGRCPDNPSLWGWRSETRSGFGLDVLPRGRQVGWVTDEHVYLDPEVSVGVAAQQAQRTGEPFSFSRTSLGKRLNEAGLLDEREEGRGLTVRKPLSDARRPVWSLRIETLFPPCENLPNLPTGDLEAA